MTESMTSCPTVEQLRALLDQSLPEAEQTALQIHIDECAGCQKLLESLVAGSESWDSAVGHLRDDSQAPLEPVLAEAVQRIKQDDFANAARDFSESAAPLNFLEPSNHPGSIGRLGNYEVSRIVGRGGMGVVVKAFDPALHRVVAVKVLAPYLANNPQARKRFVREAQAIAAVCHDHVITIHAIDESVEQPKIVMQFIDGRSLQEKLDAEGSLDLKEILRIGMQTASGLAAAHAQGLVHRDVKPSNILLENGLQRVKLTDFGLARAVDDASLTQSGVIAGTPQYMAPEQANGDAVDHRADVFSLGSVMYAMCVGHSPFRASTTMGVLKRVCHDPPRPIQELNPDIPDWLCEIIMKLLAKAPADRFQSARQVAEVLETWLAHVQQPTVVPKPVPSERGIPGHSARTDSGLKAMFQRGFADDSYARTIFFQPISGRMLLFFLLAGMAGTMATSYRRGAQTGELLAVGLLGGLMISFGGLLFVSLVRFLGANLMGTLHGARGTGDFNTAGSTFDSTSHQTRAARRLPAESVAMLAAIITILWGAHPLLAALVAIIVWRVAVSRTATDQQNRRNPSTSTPGNTASMTSEPSSFSGGLAAILRSFSHRLGNVFDFAPTERNRLLIVIGWSLAGALDLVWMLFLMQILALEPNLLALLLTPVALAFGLFSLATSYCIYVHQNYDSVRRGAFLGLLPMSFGAVLRIPLCVATSLWLHRPEVKQSFSVLPWSETNLGRLVSATYARLRRILATCCWIAAWSIACVATAMTIGAMYLVPYGPSVYHINDQSAKQIVNKQNNIRFGLEAGGTGPASGLLPGSDIYRCNTALIYSIDKAHHLKLYLDAPVTIQANGRKRNFTKGDVETFFQTISGNPHPEEAASLFQTIEQIRSAQGAATTSDAPALSLSERIRYFDRVSMNFPREAFSELNGYVPLASLVDPAMFTVNHVADRPIFFACQLAGWLIVTLTCSMLLVWPAGIGWIVFRRHWSRAGVV